MHTIIIGNGIIALTTAFRLAKRAQPHDRITIIGKKQRQGSATLAAAAMFNSFAEIESDSLNSDLDFYKFELSHLATRLWPKFEDEINNAGATLPPACSKCSGFKGGGCVDKGTFVINNNAADDLDDENFDAIVHALEQFDEPFDHISPRDIPNYAPAQKYRATRALYIPNEGWMNPKIMMGKLDTVLAHFPSVQFIDNNAIKILRTQSTISGVLLDSEKIIEGDHFILATGASATDLLNNSQLGIDVPRIFYGVGVSIEIKNSGTPHTKCIRTPNRGLACGIYATPYFKMPNEINDHLILGASNFISPTPVNFARMTSVELIMRAGMEQINEDFYRAEVVEINVGWRPTSQDTYPLIGKTSISNLIIATGTKRDGFHLSPVISEKIVALLYNEPVDERFAWFAPERAPIRSLTREQAIAKTVRHQMNAAYQHGFHPAKNRMPQQVLQMFKDELEKLHDKVNAHDWGIPPEMIDMYRYGHAK